ncbi:MAG: hypothetical protein LBD24_07475, partial [Spirochaetaceae bacterium]|nr:hypothetical protein [Spirochaetaceae bacterium]
RRPKTTRSPSAASKLSETARERSRASTATSEVTGQGVAPFTNNRRPCLKQPEAGRPCCASRRRRVD